MTGLKDELESAVKKIISEDHWTTRKGHVVPELDNIGLANDGVLLDATVLYADLSDSTDLVAKHSAKFAAEVYKTYLYCAARIINAWDGAITAYDGDRIMAVFIGGSKNTQAVQAALRINYCVQKIINPVLAAEYSSKTYRVSQKVGVDTSELLVARTGMRGRNDLVWVGTAANNAAKMAALNQGCSTYISTAVYNKMGAEVKMTSNAPSVNMWKYLDASMGRIVGSTYWRSIDASER